VTPTELEVRAETWREHLSKAEARMHDLRDAVSRPGATADTGVAFTRAKKDYVQYKYLLARTEGVLARGEAQQQEQEAEPQDQLPSSAGQHNYQRIFSFLNTTLKDWMVDAPLHDKLVRLAQMGTAQMQEVGWPDEQVTLIRQFQPLVVKWRAAKIEK
jgi:hypothetical protein